MAMSKVDFSVYEGWLPEGVRPFEEIGHGPFTMERVEQVEGRNFLMHLRHQEGTPEVVGYHCPIDFYIANGMEQLAEKCPVQIGAFLRTNC